MSSPTSPLTPESDEAPAGLDRRRFLTFMMAAPTLAVAVNYGFGEGVALALPGTPEPADFLDLGDILILAAKPTEGLLIVLVQNPDGSVSCALPREEVGQGITTATAMIIADELSLPLSKVKVTVGDARPELLTGQVTGGSNTIRSVYEPIKRACAAYRGRMAAAGAQTLGVARCSVVLRDGSVVAQDGRSVGFGDLAVAAASPSLKAPLRRPAQRQPRAVRRAPPVTASTPAPWSRGSRSTPTTSSPSRACCARWSAGRRRSAARVKSVLNGAASSPCRACASSRWSSSAGSSSTASSTSRRASPSWPRPSGRRSTPRRRWRSPGTSARSRRRTTRRSRRS